MFSSLTRRCFFLALALCSVNTLPAHAQTRPQYRIMSVASGKVLDVPGFSTRDGARIQQYTWNNGNNQRWYFDLLPDGSYKITNVYSGKVLDIPFGQNRDGIPVQQYTWNGGANQRWVVESLLDGKNFISPMSGRSVLAQRKVLDVPNGAIASGIFMQQFHINYGNNQKFYIQRVN